MKKYTDEDILAIETSVPVAIACDYLGVSKSFLYAAMQKQVLPIGAAVFCEKEWSYDIRPQALVEYNRHGGIKQWKALETFLTEFVKHTAERISS